MATVGYMDQKLCAELVAREQETALHPRRYVIQNTPQTDTIA